MAAQEALKQALSDSSASVRETAADSLHVINDRTSAAIAAVGKSWGASQ
jgi:hypothetical protein